MELNDRKRKILAAIIDDYIKTAEPVGSRVISQKAGLGLSSATIRNEMAELTALGYLEQPHTSAGRVPSHMGYRLYVNELMRRHRLSADETATINREFQARLRQLDTLISDIGNLAAQLTMYPALTLRPPSRETIARFDLIQVDAYTVIVVVLLSDNSVKNKLIQLSSKIEPDLLPKLSLLFNAGFTGITEDRMSISAVSAAEKAAGDTCGLTTRVAAFAAEALSGAGAGEVHVTGASRLLSHPEFRDPDRLQRLLIFLSDSDRLLTLASPGDGLRVMIGPENDAEELSDISVVIMGYDSGSAHGGVVGIIGPTRMEYSKVAARLRYFAESLSRILGGDLTLLPPSDPGDDFTKDID